MSPFFSLYTHTHSLYVVASVFAALAKSLVSLFVFVILYCLRQIARSVPHTLTGEKRSFSSYRSVSPPPRPPPPLWLAPFSLPLAPTPSLLSHHRVVQLAACVGKPAPLPLLRLPLSCCSSQSRAPTLTPHPWPHSLTHSLTPPPLRPANTCRRGNNTVH